jgi:polysaccharide deacetylase 2 family uncharacterized protein YibQ
LGKGLFVGAFWGTVVSVIVLTTASLILPLPEDTPMAPAPEQPLPDMSGEGETDTDETDLSEDIPEEDQVPVADTSPADVPDAPNLETRMAAPSLPETVNAPEAETVPSVSVSPDVMQPQMPNVEGPAKVAVDPVQPVAPDVDSAAPTVGLEEGESDLSTSILGGDAPARDNTASDIAVVEQPADTLQLQSPSEDEGVDETAAPLPPPLALEEFAVPFSNPEGRPVMSIVLMDGRASPFPADVLDTLPVPVSFAVEAGSPGAPERMRRYRDAGYEVLVIPAVAPNASLSEMDAAIDAALAEVSEAVAFLDPFETGYTQQPALAEQGISRLLETGHGLLHLVGDGTNPDVIALRAGVPSLSISRDFDAKAETARTIMRFMDGAAFKARQQGVVVMLGRTRPETFEAITLWAGRDRATSVAIAPISAAFRAEAGG